MIILLRSFSSSLNFLNFFWINKQISQFFGLSLRVRLINLLDCFQCEFSRNCTAQVYFFGLVLCTGLKCGVPPWGGYACKGGSFLEFLVGGCPR